MRYTLYLSVFHVFDIVYIYNFNLICKLVVLQADSNIVTLEEAEKVKSYIDKVRAIKDVLRRDHMKVAFFGR